MRYQQIIVFSLFSLFFLGPRAHSLNAQSRAQLERERLEIIQKIEAADQLLSQNSVSQKATLRDFRALESKIKNRERLVSSIQNELVLAEREMRNNRQKTLLLQQDLNAVKSGYYALLNSAYKRKLSTNRWAYILNAKSINASFERWKYIQQYELYTKKLYREMLDKNEDLKSAIADLDSDIAGRQLLLDEEKNQFKQIQEELITKDEILKELKDQESTLKQDLNERKIERESLNAEIETTIIAALKGESQDNSSPTNVSNSGYNIEKQKGKLPWPTTEGVVISRFGKQRHPTIKDVFISNNGVDIQLGSAMSATSVYAGQVVGVSTMPGFGKTVILKHGSFYTVYAKLAEISVYDDQFVQQGDIIGKVAQEQDGSYILHFEFWEGKKKWDPMKWIKR